MTGWAPQKIDSLEAEARHMLQEIDRLRTEVEKLKKGVELRDQQNTDLHDMIADLHQERDQLKKKNSCQLYVLNQIADYIKMPIVDGRPLGNYKKHLANHDAEVIKAWLKKLPISNRAVRISDVRKSAQDYANQLRQQATDKK